MVGSWLLVDKLGRRPILIWGMVGDVGLGRTAAPYRHQST